MPRSPDAARGLPPPVPLQTRATLDAAGCGTPGCAKTHDEIYLHPSCHPAAELAVAYDPRNGAVVIRCARCERPVTRIAVAASVDG